LRFSFGHQVHENGGHSLGGRRLIDHCSKNAASRLLHVVHCHGRRCWYDDVSGGAARLVWTSSQAPKCGPASEIARICKTITKPVRRLYVRAIDFLSCFTRSVWLATLSCTVGNSQEIYTRFYIESAANRHSGNDVPNQMKNRVDAPSPFGLDGQVFLNLDAVF